MPRERWLVDGWELTEGNVRDVEYRAGLYRTPQAEGEDGEVSNRTGRLWRPKVHGPGSFTLAMWWGSDVSRADLEAKWDEVLRALVHPHRLSTYERHLADGTIRRCEGDLVASIEPTALGQLGVRAAVEVRVPAAYWRGTVARTATVAVGGTYASRNTDLVLTPFARSTALMEHLTFTITGPVSNPRVIDRTDGSDGEFFHYAGTIPAGQSLVVNASTWGISGTGGFAALARNLFHSGGRFLAVPPARPGQTPTVRLYGESVQAATSLKVDGAEAFLL